MFMYLECCPAEVCPFHSMLMALLLSCAKLLSSMIYPCASMKCTIHRVCSTKSVAATSFATVQHFVLSFCLDDFALSAPFPIMVMPPVWLVMLPCKVYAASTHVFNIFMLRIDRVRGILMAGCPEAVPIIEWSPVLTLWMFSVDFFVTLPPKTKSAVTYVRVRPVLVTDEVTSSTVPMSSLWFFCDP